MVINFSNALLQSSVNSFGSIAMAGYTAANNLLGFLYVSVNAVTQACMSFTSQNYGAGKYKRMDRVLADCMILSVVTALVLGCAAYFFGPQILTDLHENSQVIGSANGDSFDHYYTVFLVRNHGSDPWGAAGNGALRGTYDPICNRHSRNPNSMDLLNCSHTTDPCLFVYFLSGILDPDHCHAGDLFLFCQTKSI